MTFKKDLKTLSAGLLLSMALAVPVFAEDYEFSNYRGGFDWDGVHTSIGIVGEKDFKFGNGFEASVAIGTRAVVDSDSNFGGSETVRTASAVGTLGYSLGSNITPYVGLGIYTVSGDYVAHKETNSYSAGIDWRSGQFALGVEYRKYESYYPAVEIVQLAGIYSPTDNVDVYLGVRRRLHDRYMNYNLGTDVQFGGFGANLDLTMNEDFLSTARLKSRFEYGFELGDSLFGPSSTFGKKLYVYAGVHGRIHDLDKGYYEYGIGTHINDETRVDLSYFDRSIFGDWDDRLSVFINHQIGKKRLRVIDEYHDAYSNTLPNFERTSARREF